MTDLYDAVLALLIKWLFQQDFVFPHSLLPLDGNLHLLVLIGQSSSRSISV